MSPVTIAVLPDRFSGPGSSVGIGLSTSWKVRESNPDGGRFSAVQTCPGAHPAHCAMGTGSFPGVKYVRGVLLTTHPLLVPRSWKSRAIPLPTLWATTGPVTGTLYLYRYRIALTVERKHARTHRVTTLTYSWGVAVCPRVSVLCQVQGL